MIIDSKEWKLVPVEAAREMLDAAHFGPNCAEEGLSASDEMFWIDAWNAMLNSAPKPPEVVVVSAEMLALLEECIRFIWASADEATGAKELIAKLRTQILKTKDV